ncbi:MAG: hypothetical protein ABJI43_16715 [Roseobacter sp.]
MFREIAELRDSGQPSSAELPFADQVNDLDVCCRIERFKGLHRVGKSHFEAAILLNNMVEVFHRENIDRPARSLC